MAEKRLTQEQVKIGMYVTLLENISKNLRRYLHENKAKKKSLAELQAVSQKSCVAIKKMADKFKEGFLKPEEVEALTKIETEINYEVVIGKFENKFRWEYTKNLVDYLENLSNNILDRSGIEKVDYFI